MCVMCVCVHVCCGVYVLYVCVCVRARSAGLMNDKMALITSGCGALCSPSIKWPFSPRVVWQYFRAAGLMNGSRSRTQIRAGPRRPAGCHGDSSNTSSRRSLPPRAYRALSLGQPYPSARVLSF